MQTKLEIALTNGSWLKGMSDIAHPFNLNAGKGIHLNDVHRSSKEPAAGTVPLATRVFVPYSAILFIVIEK